MRYVIPLVLIPAAIVGYINFAQKVDDLADIAGGGRGHVHPPLVAEVQQINCLATMIYGEARGEVKQGQVAVAYTALNRAVKTTVCDVILARKQYSVFNNNPGLQAVALNPTLSPQLKNSIDRASWKKAQLVAHDTIRGLIPDPTNGATHYVADKVMVLKKYRYPKWTKQFQEVAVINNHRFFKKD